MTLPTGDADRYRPCRNPAVTLRYARLGGGLVAAIPVCGPHEEWWDLTATDRSDVTVEADR